MSSNSEHWAECGSGTPWVRMGNLNFCEIPGSSVTLEAIQVKPLVAEQQQQQQQQ